MRQIQPLRETIIHLLEKHHLLTATEMLDELSFGGFEYNKTSVYRALDKLHAEKCHL